MAVRAATSAIDPARHVIIYLPNSSSGMRGMLHHVVGTLGRIMSLYTATLGPKPLRHAEGDRTHVVFIDEAHPRRQRPVGAIRMLTDHHMDSRSPFAAMSFGQPSLRLGVLAALNQRIAVRY
ncbi:hypothetical protein NGTWS0302_05410 [Mycolicibacterium cyprinidarum]|uniref:Uncharacterized protein n=1 Tax=Mycolicibacterium cyprinidarum TaxID=2860311 RepID=A0ABQ4VC54_9MYCO|nr:hypothetical protein NGTWS0302_05410 [Mycolicibacterium sp. NGTWS0302]GJF17826.1 hypothetical protein NGTWS1702_24840 [Mycolicibacterium sp. NGTWSNA01]